MPKRLYASGRIELINSEAANPWQAIFDTKAICSFNTLPDLKETPRSFVSPNIEVNFNQSLFTSVSITFATAVTSPTGATAPAQVTATTSITRSSTA